MSKTKKTSRIGGVKWWVVVLIIVAAVGITCGVFKLTDNLTKGVTDFVYNQDNLVRTIEEYEGTEGNIGNGLTLKAYDNKSIRIDGKINDGSGKYEWVLGNVVVKEDGKYTLSGVKGASMSTIYLEGSYTDEDGNPRTFYGDISNTMTVELTEGIVVKLKLVLCENVNFSKTIEPTFVLGDKEGKF